MNAKMPKRAAALIVREGKILLMHRYWRGREYYVFPGGGVEKDETPEMAVVRELKEEFCIDIEIKQELFSVLNDHSTERIPPRFEHYYLVANFSGTPKLGGHEKEISSEDNRFEPAWVQLFDLDLLPLVPEVAKDKLLEIIKTGSLDAS
ncbi:MAG: CTP pyrophosphohydrolase [bacterium ADurb.Bin400]|nr:MAG: CTP pyrophosphohydrolase [bacterium ADurb.Bin400]